MSLFRRCQAEHSHRDFRRTFFAPAGNTVIIGGTDLTGAVAVTFEGTPATSFHVDDSNHIAAVTPAHAAGPVDVRVTTSNGTSLVNPNGVYTYAASS